MINEKFKFEISIPENGWVIIRIRGRRKEIEFNSSNVPNDSIEELLNCLNEMDVEKENKKVKFHLEPKYKELEILKEGNDYTLKLNHQSNYFSQERLEELKVKGNYKEIILPLYRGLCKFDSYEYEAKDWNKLDRKRLEKLKNKIKLMN